MAKVELKQPIVDEIKAQLDGAKSMVVVDYRGISVADVTTGDYYLTEVEDNQIGRAHV